MKYWVIFFSFFLIFGTRIIAQMAINTDNSNPDPSAILDVKSNSKGVLLPRMTFSQLNAIVSPAAGLMVYCIDCGKNGSGSLAVYSYGMWYVFNSTPGSLYPSVTTASVTNIGQFTALSGGNVTDSGGSGVLFRGICWSTHSYPTLANSHTTDGSGLGVFTSNISGLNPLTYYYLRSYAMNSNGTAYGNQKIFLTVGDCSCPGVSIVTWGGMDYHTVQIGTQCWFKENLNIGTRINSDINQTNNSIMEKYCYADVESSCSIYGGLYQWNEMMQYSTTQGAQGLCPTGWHTPTDGDWTTLSNFLGGESVSGGKLKSLGTVGDNTGLWADPNTGATDSVFFTGFPGGLRSITPGIFIGGAHGGYFWTSTQASPNFAWRRLMSYDNVTLNRGNYDKGNGFSVRCIKNN